MRYHTDLRAVIASAKCLDMSIELRLTITETILCGFQRRIGQRRVATPTNEKSYGLEIYELQIQKRHELSTPSRLTVVQTIRVDTRGQPARRHISDQVGRSQVQQMHHRRTRRLPIVASMIFDKLPSNWVNWRLQGRCQSPYIHKSRVTGNAKAGHSPEAVYELHTIHVNPHRRWQFQSQFPSARLNGVIYVTDNDYWYDYRCHWSIDWQSSR